MYICNECQSTDFEKFGGFLFCAVCHVQHPDYVEQSMEYDSLALSRVLSQKREKPNLTLKKTWTLWDAYNYILHGLVDDLITTGWASEKLRSNTISLWACFLESSGVKMGPPLIYKSHKKRKKSNIDRKRRKEDEGKCSDTLMDSLSQSNSCVKEQLMRRMIYKKHKKFIMSQSTQACDEHGDETIETIGRTFHKDGYLMSQDSNHSEIPPNFFKEETANLKRKLSSRKKTVKVGKGRLLGILHIALLLDGSQLQLSDLIRFIRESHLSFAKITHFLPMEIKVTKGDFIYLETVSSENMPKHSSQRLIGRELAKKLNIEDFPFPNMKCLLTRYCSELNLPDEFIERAMVISQLASVEKLCSFQHTKRGIPNYEGMAAACLIYVIKVLFKLDDRTEFLLSDVAEKANKFLDSEKDKLLFSFSEWQKFIELRKAVLKEVHYPTEEKFIGNDLLSSSGLIDVVTKESKDKYRENRFTSYCEYFMDPKLMNVCQDLLSKLTKPKTEFKMDFPPSLTPLASYLSSILNHYDERIKDRSPNDAYLPKLQPRALEILRKSYADCNAGFVSDLTNYEEFLTKNGFTLKKIHGVDVTKRNLEKERGCGSCEKCSFQSDAGAPVCSCRAAKKSKSCRVQWPDIDLLELPYSEEVYLIEDLTTTWKLMSPRLDDNLELTFLTEVFEKTPVNFQWIVKELSLMLEMTEKDIYLQLYKLEAAIQKVMQTQ